MSCLVHCVPVLYRAGGLSLSNLWLRFPCPSSHDAVLEGAGDEKTFAERNCAAQIPALGGTASNCQVCFVWIAVVKGRVRGLSQLWRPNQKCFYRALYLEASLSTKRQLPGIQCLNIYIFALWLDCWAPNFLPPLLLRALHAGKDDRHGAFRNPLRGGCGACEFVRRMS